MTSAIPPNAAKSVAVYGSGPSGLMAATRLREAGFEVHLFERRPAFGRKLLIAGSSGLNITHDAGVAEFVPHYSGFAPEFWERCLRRFGPRDWIAFIEKMGFETFAGTSGRYFVREMKASGLLRAWTERLRAAGVVFHFNHEWSARSELDRFAAAAFFLGGGSWEDETPRWLARFPAELGVRTNPFYSTNVGYEVAWSEKFLAEAEGKPLKNILFRTSRGEKAGELVVTRYGLEGTPVYFQGAAGLATIDLKPALTLEEVTEKLRSVRENLAPLRRAKKTLALNETAQALLFHHLPEADRENLDRFAARIKAFPIELLRPRPLAEAISSGGGVALEELHDEPGRELMLRRHPGIFCGGEMLDWVAPTGGYLIQGAVTQGAIAADNLIAWLGARPSATA